MRQEPTHKGMLLPSTLRLKVESDVIPLCGFDSILILVCLPVVYPLGFFQQLSGSIVCVTGSDDYSLIPISKVFLMEVSDKRVPFKCVNDNISL